MPLLNITCKKATYLISKKEEGRLNWLERWQLRGHLTICSLCRRFEDQTHLLAKLARKAHEYLHHSLSPEAKQRMEEVLKNQD